MVCRICSVDLEFDFTNPFCDSCWNDALHKQDSAAALALLRWIARIDES